MRDDEGSVLDLSTARAWVTFQARLGDRLAEMEDDDVLVVETLDAEPDEEGATPYVQFCGWGGDLVRGEVAGNHVLRTSRELTPAGERALVDLGYAAPTYGVDDEPDSGSLNFHVDLPRSEADRLAVMTVRALRDVFGVAHPALLAADGLEGDEPVTEESPALAQESGEPAAVFPEDGHEHLVALVDEALTPYLGEPPEHDEDGDIPIDAGDTVLYVRVLESMPVVELFACVATDVDVERAAFEVQVLNRDVRFLKFQLLGDSIVAYLHLPAWPFAPEHLRAMVAIFKEAVERVERDVVTRVARSEPNDPHPDADAASATVEASEGEESAEDRARRILLHLDAEAPGSVDPTLAASICGHDADLILRMIDADSREEIEWREASDDALAHDDADTAAVCDHEAEHAARTVSLLRRALRVVVERDAARAAGESAGRPGGEAAGGGPRRAARRPAGRPRRVPDPTLEEVDPEIWG